MGAIGRRQTLLFCAAAFVVGCTKQSGASLPAPVAHPPGRQIPVDLDVVLRVDLARLRQALNAQAAEALGRLIIAQVREPEALMIEAVTGADRLWVGLRPDPDPRRWDNVVIVEGDFSGISSARLAETFGPSRDLGGGVKVYDAKHKGVRTAPARLYTYQDERWLFASEAEVDALERVVERGRAERHTEPPARGLASITANLGRVEADERGHTSLRAFQKARSFEGSVDLKGSQVMLDARIEFSDEDDAKMAERALLLLSSLALGGRADIHAEAASSALTVRARFPLELAAALVTSSPKN